MSSTYSGNGTSPTSLGYTPIAISSSTNATPIVVTTGSAHGFSPGDTVVVENHAVNTNANGRWVVLATPTGTTFSLAGSTGNGVGGATGYVIDYNVGPAITIPSDGDDFKAGAFNPAYQALEDHAPFLYERVGAYRLYTINRTAHSDAIDQGTVGTVSVPNTLTWTTIATFAYQWSFARNINIYNTDVLLVQASAFLVVGTGSNVNAIALGAAFNGGSQTLVSGSAKGIYQVSTQLTVNLSATLYASDFTASQSNSMVLSFMGYNAGVSSQTFTVENPYHVNVYHYRAN